MTACRRSIATRASRPSRTARSASNTATYSRSPRTRRASRPSSGKRVHEVLERLYIAVQKGNRSPRFEKVIFRYQRDSSKRNTTRDRVRIVREGTPLGVLPADFGERCLTERFLPEPLSRSTKSETIALEHRVTFALDDKARVSLPGDSSTDLVPGTRWCESRSAITKRASAFGQPGTTRRGPPACPLSDWPCRSIPRQSQSVSSGISWQHNRKRHLDPHSRSVAICCAPRHEGVSSTASATESEFKPRRSGVVRLV